MRISVVLCMLLVVVVLVVDGKKSFSSRRKSGSSGRRSGSTYHNPAQAIPATTNTGTVNTNFLNSERIGSSQGSNPTNTHYRGNVFGQEPPKHNVPQTNGPIGFEKFNNPNQNIGFGKLNSDVQQKPGGASVPSAPSYPGKSPVVPNGPPPAYPGLGGSSGTHTGNFEPPPAYPGRPVNAPPVYSPNNPSYGQRTPGQPGVGGYPNQQGGYQQSPYPAQGGNYQGGYHPQQTSYQGQNFQGQQNFGYPNAGGNFGNGFNQGSYPNSGFGGSYPGGYGQNNPGFGGGSYGGSPFGHSNSYGGSPYSPGFGGQSFGGSNFGNSHYSPNNFGFSGNSGPFGGFGGFGGGYNNYGYHKKSRFGGLPIPIPIPIPIPFGGFGGYGRSHNHHVLDSFIKNKTVNSSDNETTSVYILNNSTVTPCTTDQFIYDSLNVTVVSCTAVNCTAIKIFTTTNFSGDITEKSSGITMCFESNVTYSIHADNTNPTVSDVHRYWMKLCKIISTGNFTGNVTEPKNEAVTIVETVLNDTVVSVDYANSTNSSEVLETTTESTVLVPNSNLDDSLSSLNSSLCEIFDCYWIEMCLQKTQVAGHCEKPECSPVRTEYQPCVKVKMCKSPTTPVSAFATLNVTISRIDQLENITNFNDIANLTLISYIPPSLPANCSDVASDPACQPSAIIPQEVCASNNSTANTEVESTTPQSGNLCTPVSVDTDADSSVVTLTTETSSVSPIL